jgi:putative acetyltransferase
VTIRQETAADHDAVRAVNEGAFGRPTEADLVDSLRSDPSFVPELSLAAETEHGVVGYVLFTRVTVDGHPDLPLLGLAPVAVLPDHQSRGIGSELIRRGLDLAREMGYLAVVLLGHPHYYPRFGFVPASRLGLKSTYDVPDEVFMAMELQGGSLEDVNGTVHYSAPFSAV